MGLNALRNVPWILTTRGAESPAEALKFAHEIEGLDLSRSAFEVSSQLRILVAIFSLVVREQGGSIDLRMGLDPQAIDSAVGKIGNAANLDDPLQPFLQQCLLEDVSRDKTGWQQRIASEHPVKKLSPTVSPDQANEFWSRSNPELSTLPVADAVLALAVFHHFFPVSNSRYGGQKCTMGSPGFRFLGRENTATEVIWKGKNLLETLALNTPKRFVESEGLPAWADRTGELSCASFEESPLWSATWSSNAPACIWDEGTLVGVHIGGVPESWFRASMGKSKETRKTWWDERNLEDPFYLYIPNDKGELKAQRLDVGRDPTELAIGWLAEEKFEALRKNRPQMVLSPTADQDVLFFRHQIEGTSTSPSIRESSILDGDHTRWAPDPSVSDELVQFSRLVHEAHGVVTAPFREFSKADRAKLSRGETPFAFGQLKGRRADASTAYWRYVSEAFIDSLEEVEDSGYVSNRTLDRVRVAGLRAFDETVGAHYGQMEQLVSFVRGHVVSRLYSLVEQEKVEEVSEA